MLIELLTHAIVVADVHDDVTHTAISSALVAVGSPTPKSSPATVTELPPLGAAFRRLLDATGASNETIEAPVPIALLTVTAISLLSMYKPDAPRHTNDDDDIHDDVAHSTPDIREECV